MTADFGTLIVQLQSHGEEPGTRDTQTLYTGYDRRRL